jgi:hypothetical protein
VERVGLWLGALDTVGESEGWAEIDGLALGWADSVGAADGIIDTLGLADGVFHGGTSTLTLKRFVACQHLADVPAFGQVDVLLGLQ